jgi:hypothetical protein
MIVSTFRQAEELLPFFEKILLVKKKNLKNSIILECVGG